MRGGRRTACIQADTGGMIGKDGVYRGHDCVRRFLEDWQQGFGPGSDAPVRMEWTQVCRVKDRRLCRSEAWSDRRKAFESVGLVK